MSSLALTSNVQSGSDQYVGISALQPSAGLDLTLKQDTRELYLCSLALLANRSNGRKEGNLLFNDALNTFHFTVISRSNIW